MNALEVDGVACGGRGSDHLQAAIDQAAVEQRVLRIPATGAACLVDDPLWTSDGTRVEAEPDAVVKALPGFSFDDTVERVTADGNLRLGFARA